MDIEEKRLKRVLADFEKFRSEYYSTSGRARDRIVDSVRRYGDNLPDELYFELNQNNASGLFRNGFFETDLDRSIGLLSAMLGM